MSKRRGRGEGSIFQRRDGRWVACITLGWRNGKRQRRYKYCDSQNDALDEHHRLKEELKQGRPTANATLAEYAERWLAQVSKELKPRTAAYYEQHLRLYVLPDLGKRKVCDIRSSHVRSLLAGLRERGFSKNTVRLARAVISTMFADAMSEELVFSNPALAVRTGRRRAGGMAAEDRIHAIRPLNEEELARFLEAAKSDATCYPLFLFLCHSGARPSEAYALQWSDIDFGRREILIERALSAGQLGTTKTGRARQVDMSPELSETLRQLDCQRAASTFFAAGPRCPSGCL